MDPVAVDDRREVQADAELLELDGDAMFAPEPWAIGIGNSPPARKLASLPLSATRFGSARLWNRPRCCMRANHHAKVVFLAEDEEVQEVAERELP